MRAWLKRWAWKTHGAWRIYWGHCPLCWPHWQEHCAVCHGHGSARHVEPWRKRAWEMQYRKVMNEILK